MELRLAKTTFSTSVNNVGSPRSHLLDIARKVNGIGKYGINWVGGMLLIQLGGGEGNKTQ